MKRALLVVISMLLLAGYGLSAVEGFVASRYAGTYKGTWTNTTTGASGAGSVAIELNSTARTASLTLDFDGNYLGLNNPPPITMTGTYNSNGAVVKGSDAILGEYIITIDRSGKIVGLLKNLAGGTLPEMTYTGQLTKDRMDTDYKVTLADGRVMISTFRAQKVAK